MFESLLIRIISFSLGLIFSLSPMSLKAAEIDTTPQVVEPNEIVELPEQLTQEQINDLFGEDPYLGQTSYLQSPDSYSQKEN
tara:strand:+ start:3838 stop:4083 length:246 start_codon:yes stop_codon:yes gene_type:complete